MNNNTSVVSNFFQSEEAFPIVLICLGILLIFIAYLLNQKSKNIESHESTPSKDSSAPVGKIHPAPAPEPVTPKPVPPKPEPVSESGINIYRYTPRENIWICPRCDAENIIEDMECSVCHLKKN